MFTSVKPVAWRSACGVDLEATHARSIGQAAQHLTESRRRHRTPALGNECELRVGVLGAQLAERPQFVTLDGMHAGNRPLQPPHIEPGGLKVDVRPSQVDQLRDPQRVAEGHEDHGRVAVTVAPVVVTPRGFHQLLDLALGQVLAGANVGIRSALRRNCPILGARSPILPERNYLTHFDLRDVSVPTRAINGTVCTRRALDYRTWDVTSGAL